MIKVTAIKCPDSKDTIYSRAVHDWRPCSCFSNEEGGTGVFIDGGLEYLRYGWSKVKPETFEIEIEADKHTLYSDWNKQYNRFGLIKDDSK